MLGYSLRVPQGGSIDGHALFYSGDGGVDRLVVPSNQQLLILKSAFAELGLRHGSGSSGALLYNAPAWLLPLGDGTEWRRTLKDFASPEAGSSSGAFVSPPLAHDTPNDKEFLLYQNVRLQL